MSDERPANIGITQADYDTMADKDPHAIAFILKKDLGMEPESDTPEALKKLIDDGRTAIIEADMFLKPGESPAPPQTEEKKSKKKVREPKAQKEPKAPKEKKLRLDPSAPNPFTPGSVKHVICDVYLGGVKKTELMDKMKASIAEAGLEAKTLKSLVEAVPRDCKKRRGWELVDVEGVLSFKKPEGAAA